MRRVSILLVVLALGAAGCADPLPDRAIVDSLRILAIRAEPPEAAPGAKVAIDALVADPIAPGRDHRMAWAICTPGDGGVGSCGDPSRVSVLGTNQKATWTIPPDLLDEIEGTEPVRDIYVVLGIEADPVDGEAENPQEVAFKRIRVSYSATPNANPDVALKVEGASAGSAMTVPTGTQLSLEAEAGASSRETYLLPTGEKATEEARFSWWITGGKVTDAVTWGNADGVSGNGWTLPSGAAGEAPETLWLVLRDGRGGISWTSQEILLE